MPRRSAEEAVARGPETAVRGGVEPGCAAREGGGPGERDAGTRRGGAPLRRGLSFPFVHFSVD